MTSDILKKYPQSWLCVELEPYQPLAFSETSTKELPLEYRIWMHYQGEESRGIDLTALVKSAPEAWREAADTLRALADRIEREHLRAT